MAGLCGWSSGARAFATDEDVIGQMATAIRRFDDARVATASARFGAAAVAGVTADLLQTATQVVAIWGPVRFEDPHLGNLAARNGAAHALAHGYAQSGTDFLKKLTGAFALAIIDAERGETLLATDRIGTHPVAYAESRGTLVFASSLAAIDAFPGVSSEIDSQAIYDYIHFHMVPAPLTIYAGSRHLLPGTYLKWRDGRTELGTYWQMRFVENQRTPFPDLKARFRDALRTTVRDAATNGTTGTFLSGGTDSSTIAGCSARLRAALRALTRSVSRPRAMTKWITRASRPAILGLSITSIM